MKTYHKNEVIELGKKYSKKLRIIFSLGSLFVCIIYAILLIICASMVGIKNVGVIAGIVFGVIMFSLPITYLVMKMDPLKWGARYIGTQIQKIVEHDNYINKTNNVYKYNPDELFALLKDKESAEYYDESDIEEVLIRQRNKTISKRQQQHNDPYNDALSAIDGHKDYKDLSDDSKVAYHDILDDD